MKARCNKCDSIFSADPDEFNVIVCPNCNAKMRVRPKSDAGPGDAAPATKTGSAARVSASTTPSGSAPAGPGGAKLPTVMRANKVIAGKECPACKKAIDLGVQVHNCERCGTSHHDTCWQEHEGCSSDNCSSGDLQLKKDDSNDRGDEGGDTQPCKFCGEQIKLGARKCRFCGEYQSERDRQAQVQRASNPTDDDLSTGDWVVALLCSGIGCIAGIVWCIQGKKKGPKMVGISLLMVIIWNVIMAVFGNH